MQSKKETASVVVTQTSPVTPMKRVNVETISVIVIVTNFPATLREMVIVGMG
jgi:hypothetical protein